jgi:RHS repeat-associated protein
MRRIVLFLSLLLVCATAFAQQHPAAERGVKPELPYNYNGFDTVNLFNGNLIAALPLGGSYPVGGGLSYSFVLRYAGNLWEEMETCNPMTGNCRLRYVAQKDNGGMGWRLSFGRLDEPSTTGSLYASSMWKWTSPDGAEHLFYDTLHDPKCSATLTTNCDSVVTGVRYTRDGTFIRMKDTATDVRVLEFSNGERHRYVKDATAGWRLVYIYNAYSSFDAYGNPSTNWVKFDYIVNGYGLYDWKITDVHGREHWVYIQPKTETTGTDLVDKVVVKAFNNASATYDITYLATSIKRPCLDSTDSTLSSNVAFLTSVSMPSGESWQFQYDMPTAVCSDTSATMTRATLPTLGKIEWNYQRYTYSSTSTDSIGVSQRRTYDAPGTQLSHATYATVLGSTTVTTHAKRVSDGTWQPDHKTINYYDSSYSSTFGLPYTTAARSGAVPNPDGSTQSRYLSTETFDCDPNTGSCNVTADRATYVKFEMDMVTNCGNDYPCWRDRNRRMYTSRTLYVSDGGKYADVDAYTYDGLGHYRLIKTNGNFGRADVRETYTDYNSNTRGWSSSTWTGSSVGTYILDASGNRQSGYTMLGSSDSWVLNTFTSSYVLDSGVQARVYSCFDPRNGFLHRRRSLAGSIPAANDLLAVFTNDGKGMVSREEYFGGDKQSINTASLCTMTLPAHDQYSARTDHGYSAGVRANSRDYNSAGVAMPFYSMRRDIDVWTGLTKTAHDTADVPTWYSYDTSGRLTMVNYNYVAGLSRRGMITHDYTSASGTTPAKVSTRQWMEGGAFDLTLTVTEYDGFGRTWKEKTNLPSGAVSTRETTYDYAGRTATVSELMNLSSPTKKTTYSYDLHGRTTKVVPPDGTTHEVTISYAGASSATRTFKVATQQDGWGNPIENVQAITEYYDRQGRLWKVTERPDGQYTAGFTTEYTYGWGDQLTKVCQNVSGTTCGQTRLFNYDRRGLLTSEQHPEKGLNGNGTVSYTYSARGNVLRKLEGTTYGTWDLTYTYDAAGRLTEVRQTPDPFAPVTKILKEISYDSATGWGKGKVYQARRHNHDRLATDVVVTETYTYQGREGAVSKRDTCIGSSACTSGTDKKFSTSFTYNDLGLPENVVYPDCTSPAGCASSDTARTVSNAFANALLTSVWAPGITYGSLTYHDNGMVNTVTHSNGMKSVETLDPNSMRRPGSIYAQYGANPAMWSTGTYQFDGAGNVKKTGSDYYLYDGLNRVKEATIDFVSSGNNRKHRFAYDPYGNQTNKYTSVNGGAEIDNIWYVNSAVNRMSSPWPTQYDEAGNLTVWNNGSNTYTFDGLGSMRVSATSTGSRLYFYTADEERVWIHNSTYNNGRIMMRDLSGRVLREYSTVGAANAETFSWAKDYLYRGGHALGAITPSGTFHFHVDHLGNTRLVTNSAGAEVSRHKFFPFGEEVSMYSTSPETKKFTGHERDYNGGTSGENVEYLDYMHARYYSPIWGRFLSIDPVLDASSAMRNPQGWNRYSYARSQPTMFLDPDGRLALHWHFGITYVAARRQGMSFTGSISLAWKTMWVDFRSNSQSSNAASANMHAMIGDGQNAAQARAGTKTSIQNSLAKGDLAAALHTVQDSVTPMHQDHAWPGSFFKLSFREALAHLLGDIFPSCATVAAATEASEEMIEDQQSDAPPAPTESALPPSSVFPSMTIIGGYLMPPVEGALIDGVWYWAPEPTKWY